MIVFFLLATDSALLTFVLISSLFRTRPEVLRQVDPNKQNRVSVQQVDFVCPQIVRPVFWLNHWDLKKETAGFSCCRISSQRLASWNNDGFASYENQHSSVKVFHSRSHSHSRTNGPNFPLHLFLPVFCSHCVIISWRKAPFPALFAAVLCLCTHSFKRTNLRGFSHSVGWKRGRGNICNIACFLSNSLSNILYQHAE